MLWMWPAQVASACCGNVTAPPSPVPWVSMSKLAVDVHPGPVCARAEVARLQAAHCCPMCTAGCHKSGSVVSPQGTGIAFGCSGCWCCAEVVPSWRRALPHWVTLHPPRGTQRAAEAQGPAEVLLSCAVAVTGSLARATHACE